MTNDERKMWMAIASLGEPVTIQSGAKVDVVLPDRTIDVVRLAAKFGTVLDSNGVIAP